MYSVNEVLQSNSSCCMDDDIRPIFKSDHFFQYKYILNKEFLTDFDQGSFLLENLLRKLTNDQNDDYQDGRINDQFRPIKIPLSEIDENNLDFPFKYFSFTSSFEGLHRKVSQFTIGKSYLNCRDKSVLSGTVTPDTISSDSTSFGEFSLENCNYVVVRISTIIIRNYIYEFSNSPTFSNILLCMKTNYDYHICFSSTEKLSYEILYMIPYITYNNHGKIYKSFFESTKQNSAKSQIFVHRSLTISSHMVFSITTFPIKNSGFDFFSPRDLSITILSSQSQICSDFQLNTTSLNVDGESFQMCQNNNKNKKMKENFMKTDDHFRNSFSSDAFLHTTPHSNTSILSNDYEQCNENSSKLIIHKCKPRFNFIQKSSLKTNRFGDSCRSSFLKSKNDVRKSQSHLDQETKYSFSENPNQYDNNQYIKPDQADDFTKDKLQMSFLILGSILKKEIMLQIQPIIDTIVDDSTNSIVFQIWNSKLFCPKRNFKPLNISNTSKHLENIQMNPHSFLLRKHTKSNINKDAISSVFKNGIETDKSSQLNVINNNFFNSNLFEKREKFLNTNIYDLLISQTLLGQPPRSCIKSKLSSRTVNRELNWNLKTSNFPNSICQTAPNTNNNRSEIENKLTSIFDFAKLRCLSADSSPKINLTNEEIIKASKRSLSHAALVKFVNGDDSRKNKRSAQRRFICNPSNKTPSSSRELPSVQISKQFSISTTNNARASNNDFSNSPRRLLMNRYKCNAKSESRPPKRKIILSNINKKVLF